MNHADMTLDHERRLRHLEALERLFTPAWNDYVVSAHSMRDGVTPPLWSAWNGALRSPEFSNAATRDLHCSFELLHDWKEGSDFEVHAHWTPSTTNTGNCKWGLDYCILSTTGASAAPTTVTITPAANGVVRQESISSFGTISGAGLTIGTIIDVRIYRLGTDAADTFTGSAFLHSVGLHHLSDTLGSRTSTVK